MDSAIHDHAPSLPGPGHVNDFTMTDEEKVAYKAIGALFPRAFRGAPSAYVQYLHPETLEIATASHVAFNAGSPERLEEMIRQQWPAPAGLWLVWRTAPHKDDNGGWYVRCTAIPAGQRQIIIPEA